MLFNKLKINKMNRREFLKKSAILGGMPIVLNSIPFSTFGSVNYLNKLFGKTDNENILVLVQLHGGNDGLNTFVPINKYSEYYNIRANVALPYTGKRKFIQMDDSLPDNQQLGLHPDMLGVKALFDEESATVVQNVGYENYNMSHFRSRDIMFMGGGSEDNYNSGWLGRYLNHYHSDYPTGYPSAALPDPLALELGDTASLAFHRSTGIKMGLSLASPQSFYDLISGVGINPPTTFPDNYYGDELEYIMQMELQANSYAQNLKIAYDKGNLTQDYPELYPLNAPPQYKRNYLSEQFKILTKLITGGSKTKIYIIRLGGFDTHASQVEPYDNSLGRHSALLYHLSSSVKAFYDDLKKQNLDSKVVTMTLTEFGRRIYSNASYGTDHGKAGPVMLFGPALTGGVIGENPNLDTNNIEYEIDYRQVLTALLKDWLGADNEALEDTNFSDFINNRVDLFGEKDKKNTYKDNILHNCYTNPVKDNVTFTFTLKKEQKIKLYILTQKGTQIVAIINDKKRAGEYQETVNLSSLKTGTYLYILETQSGKITKKFTKI